MHDHAALSRALSEGETSLVFVFDPLILDKLSDKNDPRVTFIYQSLVEMEKKLQEFKSSIIVKFGDPVKVIPELARELKVVKVFCNRDCEPYAKERDQNVGRALTELGIAFDQFKDSVFFEKHEVVTAQGGVYKVFTPFKNKWLENFERNGKIISDFECDLNQLRKFSNPENILQYNWYQEIGFFETPPSLSGGTSEALKRLEHFDARIDAYAEARNFPAVHGTSSLSVYLRNGNLSVRDMVRAGSSSRSEGAKAWLSEIIWRDFYQMILDAYPQVEQGPFKPEYGKIKWQGSEEDFKSWCAGETGFPIVDAAMRCLNATGLMHNRLRMIVASFLCKTLLVNWQKGEKYFAVKLLDYDLAANNGGWQWASSSGNDAQPYFRIFNPYTQSEKFDPKGEFIREWVPELAHLSHKEIHHPAMEKAPDYRRPIASYELNRQKALKMYSIVKNA